MQKDMDQAVSITKAQQQIPIKYKRKAYLYCIIICISTIYYGYSITLISSSSIAGLRSYYSIDAPTQVMVSILNGVLPLGSMLGCLILPYFMRQITKKQSHFLIFVFTVIVCALSVIPSFESLIFSRFCLGILVAFYNSICAGYIKQTFPSLRKQFGAIYSCGRVIGVLLCYLIANLSHYSRDQIEHILVFFGPAFLAGTQAVLINLYVPHSPIDLIKVNNDRQLFQSLSKLYDRQDILSVMNNMKRRIQIEKSIAESEQNIRLINKKNIMSYHLALLRNFCGTTFIIIYARTVMIDMKSPLSNAAPVIINSVQLAAGLFGIFLVTRVKRSKMIVFSTMALAVIALLIGLADLLEESLLCLIFMTIFMVPVGASFNSVVWSYPAQIASAAKGKYASFLSFTGQAILTLVPPYILKAMPQNSAYPIFFFFSLYLIVSFVINYFIFALVEDLKYKNKELRNQHLMK